LYEYFGHTLIHKSSIYRSVENILQKIERKEKKRKEEKEKTNGELKNNQHLNKKKLTNVRIKNNNNNRNHTLFVFQAIPITRLRLLDVS